MVAERTPGTGTRSVCIDWIKARIRDRFADEFRQMMSERFGAPESAPGGNGLSVSDSWMDGSIKLYFEPLKAKEKDFAYIQVTGTGCSLLGMDDCVELTRLILDEWSGRFTRFDGAIDHEGDFEDLIDTMHAACYEGKLVGAKRFGIDESEQSGIPIRMNITATKARGITGQTLYIGARGNGGSGRYLRVYDKGLQTGQAEQGQWIRFEVEATRDVANQYARKFIDGNDSERMRTVYDTVEFREVSTSSDRHRDRREVCSWWAELVGDDDGAEILRECRRKSTAASHVRWMAECVLPNLYAGAQRFGISVSEMCWVYAGEIKTNGEAKGGAAMLHAELDQGKLGGCLQGVYEMLFEKTIRGAA